MARVKRLSVSHPLAKELDKFPNFDKNDSVRGDEETLLRQGCFVSEMWKLYL